MTKEELVASLHDIEWDDFEVKAAKSIADTNIDMLSRSALREFRNEVHFWGTIKHLDNASDEEFCREVGITDNNGLLTYAGLIMLGKNPFTLTYIPTFCADYVEIPGSGPQAIINRPSYRIDEQQNLWEASRIILRRLRNLVNTPMLGINENGRLVEDLSQYDILCEAMANQMAHADHFSSQRSCIHVFDDRIEFTNPGAMPKRLDDMEHSLESLPRNPLLAKLFRLVHLSENLGYGLHKLKTWQKVTGMPMYIETSLSFVKVTFYFQRRKDSWC